jgi:hypothetical protein
MDIAKIITRAWEVFWKHKILWVFGLLSGAIGGLSGVSSWFNYRYTFRIMELRPGEVPFSENTIEVIRWAVDHAVLFTTGIITAVLLILFLMLLLGAFTSTGIIQGNLLVEAGSEELTFEKLTQAIRPYFWRVVGLNALLGVGGMGLVVGLMAILFVLLIATMGIGMLCFFPLICLLVPVMWFLMIVVTQAMIAIVAEDLDIINALKRGWQLVTGRIGPFLLVWLLVMALTFVISIVLSVPNYIAMSPVYASMFSLRHLQDPAAMFQVMEGSMIWMVVWGTVQSLLLGVLSAFTMSVWVQTYLEAREDGTLEAPDQPEEVDPESDLLEQTS